MASSHFSSLSLLFPSHRLGKKVRVKCNEDDTIGDLKKLAAAQLGTRPEKLKIQKWYVITVWVGGGDGGRSRLGNRIFHIFVSFCVWIPLIRYTIYKVRQRFLHGATFLHVIIEAQTLCDRYDLQVLTFAWSSSSGSHHIGRL